MPRHYEYEEPSTASRVDKVAICILWAGILLAIATFLAYGFEMTEVDYEQRLQFRWQGVAYAFYTLLPSLFAWGVLKMLTDISKKLDKEAAE